MSDAEKDLQEACRGESLDANASLAAVVSMFAYLVTVLLSRGGVLDALAPGTALWWAVRFMNYLCYASVNCFVMSVSWLLITKGFSWLRAADMLLSLLLWSVVFFAAAFRMDPAAYHFSPSLFFRVFMPFVSGSFGLPSLLIALYIVSPFIAGSLSRMTVGQHASLCFMMVLMLSFIPGVLVFSDACYALHGRSLIWFVTLFILSAYIRRDPGIIKLSASSSFCFWLACAAVTTAAMYVLPGALYSVFGKNSYASSIYEYNSILTLCSSFFMFAGFMRLKPVKWSLCGLLPDLVPLMLGVCIIAACPWTDKFIYGRLASPRRFAGTAAVIPLSLMYTLAIFAVALSAEFIRKTLFSMLLGSRNEVSEDGR
ncbi:MAG: hypothetical protein IKT09_05145 [Synergistes sp.]|nr:hypothetical protein [Synergistes sp.]